MTHWWCRTCRCASGYGSHFFGSAEHACIPVLLDGAVRFGNGVQLSPFVNLYGCTVGAETRIGAYTEVQAGVVIGRRCKIGSHSFICTGVTIEDGCFIGHGTMFCNDRHPRAVRPDGEVVGDGDWTLEPTRVCAGASIGSGAVILPGVTIGAGAVVGAGSIVAKDVAPGETVRGLRARSVQEFTGVPITEEELRRLARGG